MTEKAPKHLAGGHNQSETVRFISSFRPESPSAFPQSVERIATSMVESAAKVKPGQKVLLWFDPNGLELVQAINKKCLEKGAEVSYFMRDLDVDVEEVSQLKPKEVKGYFFQQKKLMDHADNIIIVRAPENPEVLSRLSKENLKAYEDAYEATHKRRINGKVECLWSIGQLDMRLIKRK
ncbi:MAG: aminopeptidase [Patescibacteria group bacterium]